MRPGNRFFRLFERGPDRHDGVRNVSLTAFSTVAMRFSATNK
jgi:hypothetical protein